MEEKLAFSIPEFCRIHDIGLGTYLNLRRRGKQPREMHVGRRVLISVEAAADWRRDREVKLTEQRNEVSAQGRTRATLEDQPAS